MTRPTLTSHYPLLALILGVVLALVGLVVRAGQVTVRAATEQRRNATEELVHVRTSDGILNGGALVAPADQSAKPIAVIWIHGSTANFYEPTYVRIARELAARGFTTILGNTRMHDLGNVATPRGDKQICGGAYWGAPSKQVHDLAAWIGVAQERGFKQVVLVGHSAGAPAVQRYQADKQDERVAGLVLASGRVRPSTTSPDPDLLAQATQLVAAGRGEELLRFPNRPSPSFTSAATFLDLANDPMRADFFGVERPDPPVTRVHCPILAWFGTNEADIGTASDLELLKSSLKRRSSGPARVDTAMIQNADHMYDGEEALVAEALAKWADTLVRR
jgi:pimeloyl-ACP methyl ester carboxylesterase